MSAARPQPAPVTHVVGRAEIDAYAALSGDRNPLHMDEAYALAAGFAGVIAHGPIGLQTAFELVARWLGEDADAAGVRLDVAFRGPVHLGDEVTCRCEAMHEHAGDVVLELRAVNQAGGEVLQALAVVPRGLAPRG